MKTDFLRRFKDYFGQLASDKNTLIVLALFLLTFVIKNVMFYYDIDSEDNPYKISATAVALYFSIGLFIASLSLFCKNKYGLILVSLLYDAWLLSNLWYFRCYNDLLTHWNLQCVGNMDGIWDSVLIYINGADFFYIAISVAFILACVFLKCKAKHTVAAIALATASVLISLPLINAQVNELKKSPYIEKDLTINIFDENYNIPFYNFMAKGNRFYAIKFTPLLHFINQFENCFSSSYKNIKFEDSEFEKYINGSPNAEPRCNVPNVIILLFESLEEWTINKKVGNFEITPNLNRLVKTDNVLFSDKMAVQVYHGHSSDAQLLVNTGLCPILEGAVANRFFMNEFPSLGEASKLPNRKTFIPTDHTMWNQDKITNAYDYINLFARFCSDRELFFHVDEYIDSTVNEGFFVQIATMASHAPFKPFSDSSSLNIPSNMLPTKLELYIKSVNYTDAALANIVDKVMNDEKYANTIVIIIGDHAVFSNNDRTNFQKFFDLENTEFNIGVGYVPFILYSKSLIKSSKKLGLCYQSDVYPTALSLINDDYYWKGFGINLLKDSIRPYNVGEMTAISDKLINGNFFKQINK